MKILVGIWFIAALILILVVLVQKGRGGGLSAAFGGVGSSLLGTKTGDFLTWVTICLVAVWLLLSVVAAKWYKPSASQALRSPPPVSAQQSAKQPAQIETVNQPAIGSSGAETTTGQSGKTVNQPSLGGSSGADSNLPTQ